MKRKMIIRLSTLPTDANYSFSIPRSNVQLQLFVTWHDDSVCVQLFCLTESISALKCCQSAFVHICAIKFIWTKISVPDALNYFSKTFLLQQAHLRTMLLAHAKVNCCSS